MIAILLCVRSVQSQLSVAGHDLGVLALASATLTGSAFAAGLISARRPFRLAPSSGRIKNEHRAAASIPLRSR